MAAVADQELAEYLQNSHNLSVSVSPAKGRCLIANRAFHRGEVILQQEPYVCALDDSSQALRCDRCYRQSSNLKRCSACKTVFYCCANCQRSGWGLHKFECAILVRLLKEKKRSPTPSLRLVMRFLIKRRLQAERVSVSMLSWPTLDPRSIFFCSMFPLDLTVHFCSISRFS